MLDKLSPYGFKHNEQSKRVVEFLENDGQGLNLTREVVDGILNHKVSLSPMTLEGRAVSVSDWIAYINHDIDDAVHGGLISEEDLPEEAVKVLGKTSRERINSMIFSIYRASSGKPKVEMEEEVFQATKLLREFMFEEVYFSENARREEEKATRMLTGLYEYFAQHPDKLPPFYIGIAYKSGIDQSICDYISGMSDKYAYYVYENIFIPKSWGL